MEFKRNLIALRKTAREFRARLAAQSRGSRLPEGRLCVPGADWELTQTFLLDRAAELGPIFKVWLPHKMTICIVGHELGRRFLSENEARIRVGTPDLSPLFPHGFLRRLEGDVHRKYRRQFLDAFNSTPIEAHEDALRTIIRKELTGLASADQPVANATIRHAMKSMSTAIFLRLVLGVTRDCGQFAELVEAYDVYAPDGPFIALRKDHRPAYDAIKGLVLEKIEAVRSEPAAPPSLLQHLVRSDAADDTVIGNLIQIVETARYDVHGLWNWILKHLSDNPEAADLARNRQAGETGGLTAIQAIPRETLRMEQSEYLLRVAAEDIVFDGFFIPKSSHIRICIWEGHHDPVKFSDPFTYKCQRFMSSKMPASHYAPFGLDKHRCLGADWTYRLSELLVEELVTNYRWATAEDGVPVRRKFHFEPSGKFRVEIRSRETDP